MLKAIISDYDGVLFPDEYRGINTLCPNLALFEAIEAKYFAQKTCAGFWNEVRAAFDISLTDQELITLYNAADADQLAHQQSVLARYAEIKNDRLLLLLSNQVTDRTEFLRKQNQLGNFDALYFSNEIELAKPDPKIFTYVLGQHGLSPEETVFIDDDEENIRAAAAVGMKTIHFTDLHSLDSPIIEKI